MSDLKSPAIICGPADRFFGFDRNDPYDRDAHIQLAVPMMVESQTYMDSIRNFEVEPDPIAVWYLGQNGFILKAHKGPLIGIDLYLTNSCASKFRHLSFRLDRQLPVFIEPEDLDVDIFVMTHSHDDPADPETLRGLRKDRRMMFLGPFDAMRVCLESGVDPSTVRLIHPGELISLGEGVSLQAAFALPTDDSDLNHIGVVLKFANGITFYNTGDTAYAEQLHALVPRDVDICAICINGGFHNLSAMQPRKLCRGFGLESSYPLTTT